MSPRVASSEHSGGTGDWTHPEAGRDSAVAWPSVTQLWARLSLRNLDTQNGGMKRDDKMVQGGRGREGYERGR
jgi:hypothetical protein